MTRTKNLPCATDFMRKRVYTVGPDMSLAEVTRYLLEKKLSNAPVVETANAETQLIGFISERDCLEFLSNECFYGNPAPPQTVRTIMRKHPICVSPDTGLFALASIFVNHGYRHLPVTEGKVLLGIVSRRDILSALEKFYGEYVQESNRQHSSPDLTQLIHHRFLVSD